MILPCTDTTVRETPWELLPQLPARGPFQFPPPWNTIATRITNDEQGSRLEPVGYAYWRNMNAHKDNDVIHVVLSVGGPCIFTISKKDGTSSLVKYLKFAHTGEGLYFSAHNPNILFVALGNAFYRYNISTDIAEAIFEVDSSKYLWQLHSSFDENVHSATLRDNNSYEMLGAIVYNETEKQQKFFPKLGDFDECQIDRSGKFLVIKETYPDKGESNRIIDLETSEEKIISNAEGALGHSDAGMGYAIGEVDVDAQPNCVEMRDLHSFDRTIQYHGTEWSTGVGHISHTNVHNPSFIVISNASRNNNPRQNEIIQVPLDGSKTFRPLAPSAVDLDSAGGETGRETSQQEKDYRKMPKGNLCPYGEYFIWTANHRSDHIDAFILKV